MYTSAKPYFYGTGRRKKSIARVRIVPGSGKITINKRDIDYAIGVAKPLSVFIDTDGTGVIPDGEIADIVNKEFDLRPYSIIQTLDLRKPIYKKTASYGHFGRSEFPWEKLDRVEDLKKYVR